MVGRIGTKQLLKRIIVLLMVLALMFNGTEPMTVKAAEKSVDTINFKDFSNWRSGLYHWTNGKYCSYDTRICLNDYVTISGGEYRVIVTNSNYRLLIRELDKNKTFIETYTLANGQTYKPSSGTYYLGISIYNAKSEKGITYDTYRQLFANGFYTGIKRVTQDTDTNKPSDDTTTDSDSNNNDENSTDSDSNSTKLYNMNEISYKDFSNWRSGIYHWTDGKYCEFKSRICLNDYVKVVPGEYNVVVRNSNYRLLVRELDKNKTFMNTYTLANGEKYKPNANARYLGISVYNAKSEKGITYDTYKQMFKDGFYAGLEEVEEDEDLGNIVETDTKEENIITSKDNEQKVYQILKEAMLNNSSDTIDISKYGISYEKFEELWDMVKNDCFLEYHAHGNNYPTPYLDSKGNMKSFYLQSTENYQERVLKLKEVVRTFLTTVDSKMTDLDKILLAHEYVVNNVQYSKDGTSVKNTASGALVDGAAVCGGYTDAMVVLLHCMDIDTDVVNSGQMNHEWLYVKLGDNWYHIDPTWDNTRQGTNGSKAHWYLLRNDSEFQSISNKHYSWTIEGGSDSSTSKEYTSWFVHDVPGTMAYYNGLWYYVENNDIVASTIMGSNKKIIVSCGSMSECVKIDTIENGKLTYYVGNVKKVIVL